MDIYTYDHVDDIVVFNVEVNDTYNTMIIGNSMTTCINTYCEFPKLKGIWMF